MSKKKPSKFQALIKEAVGELSSKDEIENLMQELIKTVVETSLNSELDEHLGYEKHERSNSTNSRNGHYSKQLKTNVGDVEVSIPRDRKSEYEPNFIEKGSSRVTHFDEKILSCYARGMSTRDISDTFEEMFGARISHSTVSKITETVQEKVEIWQNRPLDEIYPIIYLDCIVIKVHQDKRIEKKSVYLALGVNTEGKKELLGLWLSKNEGSKFWLSVLTELNNRGVKDILIACVDGLTGFPEAISAIFPKTLTQLCIVHIIRNSLKYVSYKDKKELSSDLKLIYSSATAEDARNELEKIKDKWEDRYPSVYKTWDNRWDNIIPFFEFPPIIRKAIYTTNAIESLNSVIRKAIKNRKIFPSDRSAIKTIFLATNNAAKKWTMPIKDWGIAMQFLSIHFDGRIDLA